MYKAKIYLDKKLKKPNPTFSTKQSNHQGDDDYFV